MLWCAEERLAFAVFRPSAIRDRERCHAWAVNELAILFVEGDSTVVPIEEVPRLMRKSEAEVRWLAEMRLLYAPS